VWWRLFYDIVDCVFTAAAAIIVVISDRDLKTDFEVRLWIFMLWLYMFYTNVQFLFFGDELVYDQNFMIWSFFSDNYYFYATRLLIYQYIVMYRYS
jgi:hypothetical protein